MQLKSKYKLQLLIIIFFALIIVFLLSCIKCRNYEINYKVSNYNIVEKYSKDTNIYNINLTVNNTTFEYSIQDKYTSKRRLVSNIKLKNSCINFKFKNNKYSVCKNKNEYYKSYYKNLEKEDLLKTVNNVNIYNYNDKKYYIWNYDKFLILSNKTNEELTLFNTDVYELEYITKINNDLLVADYNQKYSFNKFYFINTNDNTYKEIEIFQDLSFDGYILGTYKKYVYLYNPNNSKEYKFNPYNQEITKVKYERLINDKWQTISKNKLDKGIYKFEYNDKFYYKIINNYIYYCNNGINIKVYSKKVDRIIESNQEEVYFISNDKLIYNNLKTGNKLIMSYSEWKYNNKNIYIFDN